MAANWAERISAFSRSPSGFLSGTTAEAFLAELLRELRDDRCSYLLCVSHSQILLLSPLCEHPTLLCCSDSVGEETALELMSVFAQCPPKSVQFRCHLLLALTSVLICTSCVKSHSRASLDFLDVLLQIAQDTSDIHTDGSQRPLRAIACECLRELEACCPGLLSQRLELLGGLWQQETSRLHQAYAELYTLVLRNAIYQLTQEAGAGAEHLKALLGGNTSAAWEADQESGLASSKDSAILSSLILGPMGTVPTLHTGPDCKELRSVLSTLLDESYLLTPLCQATLLHRLTEVVAMVPGVPPIKYVGVCPQLWRYRHLLHATLLLKCAFTDSLFSSEDEAFVLKRLVVLSQHLLLSTPEKLFYMDCILHFPENRPISCGDGDETLPVLLTPQLASALVPTVFNDSATLLARFNMLSLVYLEEGEEGQGGQGLAYLYEHLSSLLSMVENGCSRELVVTFFRAAFLFLYYFCHVERYSNDLTKQLCLLYLNHTKLAPHFINLADQTQDRLSESSWSVGLLKALQRVITEAPLTQLTSHDLSRHLKMLARVAEEGEIIQQSSLTFLFSIVAPSSSSLCTGGDWRLGNDILRVCRHLLVHPSLDSLLTPLADVLQLLVCHYADMEIQDHARLYYTLLTTLSREKLAGTERAVFRDQFSDSGFASEITLQYQLVHINSHDSHFDQLFSIRLHFSLTDHHYEELGDISVPCLLRERPSAIVQLTLKPRKPYPTSLHASAIFTSPDGHTWHTTLPDIHVSFQQTFLPLPVPSNWGRGGTLSVFEGLWDEICSESGDSAMSLFCCQLKEAALNTLVEKHFLPFLISGASHKEEFKVLFFLPPRSHILLKVSSEEDAVHFNIATDNWELLSHINSYLLKITSLQEDALS
uniref:AP-5 complex subunit beta-1 n=1 Tax=Neolamprologus brichardi TaxID=32507 RepID=A0A3Q4HJV5_NEOBR